MSAAGRGPRLGGKHDVFHTPAWTVRRLLESPLVRLPSGVWLDAGAGDGAIIKAVRSCRTDVSFGAVEIRRACQGELARLGLAFLDIVDFFDVHSPEHLGYLPVVVIGNPPYEFAMEFVKQARIVAPQAWVVFLLRIAFSSSDDRAAFMIGNPPDVFVLPNRPSFARSASGSTTDQTDYAWFVWPPADAEPRTSGIFAVLKQTPLHERQER